MKQRTKRKRPVLAMTESKLLFIVRIHGWGYHCLVVIFCSTSTANIFIFSSLMCTSIFQEKRNASKNEEGLIQPEFEENLQWCICEGK
jgi:hypothetical protein